MRIVYLIFSLLLTAQIAFSQTLIVKGTVISLEDDYSLPGVNVTVKGEPDQGTVTDIDGYFSINVQKGKTLIFSYIGYKPVEKLVKNEAPLNILLESDAIALNEVVAIGYGVMKKSDLTGAVSSVKAEQLQKTPAAGLDQALQGRAAGVTVNANSGQPGMAAEVRIRGIGTVNNSAPIYVVDGIIVSDINYLNPSDIVSTEILKDASSTAIYGSRGANGVILVTTRKGSDSGKTNITFNGYAGVQNRWRKLDLMGRDEFVNTLISLENRESQSNYYKKNGFNKWLYAYRLGSSNYYPVTQAQSADGFDYSSVDTDWQDEVFKSNAFIQNYSLSFDGGNDKVSYSLSGSYFKQEGTIIGSDYTRFTLRANSSYKVRSWLKIGENISFVTSEGRNAMNNNASPGASILSAAIAMAPWDPTHYPEGTFNSEGKDLSGQISASSNFRNVINPFSMVEHSHPSNKTERWVGDLNMEITPISGLVLRSSVSLDLSNIRNTLFKDSYEYSSFDKASQNFFSSSMERYSTCIIENTLSYAKDFNNHSLSLMLGQTAEENNYYSLSASGASILNPNKNNWLLSQTTTDRSYGNDAIYRTRMTSFLGRMHYTYKNKYMATVNFRADGSNKFPENVWGYFPSTALAWRVSEEGFMQDLSTLDYLKIRAGWGQIGNDKISNDSFILKMFNSGPSFVDYVLGENQQLANGAAILTYINKGGKWETTEQKNVGVDFSILNGVISGTVDGFIRDTRDMLLPVKAPAHVGNRYDALANVGVVRNQGIEVSLTHQSKIGDFGYSVMANASFIENKLTTLNGGERIYGDYTLCDEGLSLFTFWGYQYEGIYKSNDEAKQHLYAYSDSEMPYAMGDAKYKDLNNDGIIDDNDKTDLGSPFPWLTYGLNIDLSWKNFDMQIFFQGVYGNQIYNALRHRTEWDGTESTLSTAMRDVWTVNNPNGSIPNPYGSTNNKLASSRFVESGAYLRLKNLQLGYNITSKTLKDMGVGKCRLYVTANNLLTLTKYTGYDPEVGGGVDYGNYPQARTYMFGTTINF